VQPRPGWSCLSVSRNFTRRRFYCGARDLADPWPFRKIQGHIPDSEPRTASEIYIRLKFDIDFSICTCLFLVRRRSMSPKRSFLVLVFLLCIPVLSFCCDLCGCFVPKNSVAHGFLFGVAEQYSSLSDLSLDGETLGNANNQYMNSSYTQIFATYHFDEKTALQLNVPLIHRTFQRPQDGEFTHGAESGMGDLLLVGYYIPYQRSNPYRQFQWRVLGGLKFPTGDSSRIGEELNEDEATGELPSGVHGHDLALGSGSWDVLVGTNLNGRMHRWFFSGTVQYAIRTRGDFDYKYANDLLWNGGPGYYVSSDMYWPVGLQLLISGEHKGEDQLGSEFTDDTAITSVYLEPTAVIGLKQIGTAEIGFGIPLLLNNSGLQTVPKYRLRIGMTWTF
jgi:hypothetical protein